MFTGLKTKFFKDNLSSKQHRDMVLSILLSIILVFCVMLIFGTRNPGFSGSWAGLMYMAAWCGVSASAATTLSWLIIRPEPPLSQEDTYHLTDPPVWFVVLRPIVFAAVVWLSPPDWWAMVWLTLAWVGVFLLSVPLRREEGTHAEWRGRLKRAAERGGAVCPECGADLPMSPPGPMSGSCPKCRTAYTREGLMTAWGFGGMGP